MLYYLTYWSLKPHKYNLGPFTSAYLTLDLLPILSAVGACHSYGLSQNVLAVFDLALYDISVSLTDSRLPVIPDRLALLVIAVDPVITRLSDYIGLSDAIVGGAVGLPSSI